MAIQNPNFRVQTLSPADLLAGARQQDPGIDFDGFLELMQRIAMRDAGGITATGGADGNPDSVINDALFPDLPRGLPTPISPQIRGDRDSFDLGFFKDINPFTGIIF